MSSKPVSLFCQVGFQPKKQGSTYFHRVDWDIPYGEEMVIEDQREIRPYSVEQILAGSLDFDRLPLLLRNTITKVAQNTHDIIVSESPKQGKLLDFTRMVVTFRPYEGEEEEKVTVH